jgi:hypothetical protein
LIILPHSKCVLVVDEVDEVDDVDEVGERRAFTVE